MIEKFFGEIVADSTDVSIEVLLRNSSDSLETTGKTYSDVTAAFWRDGESPVTITPVTLASITAAHTDGGFIEVSASSLPGMYRFDIPDAAVVTGQNSVTIGVSVAGSFLFYKVFRIKSDIPKRALSSVFNIPPAIDLAAGNVRFGIQLVGNPILNRNLFPGTYAIERKAITSGTWSVIVPTSPITNIGGNQIYDVEVFDSGTGYAIGDMIKFVFKNLYAFYSNGTYIDDNFETGAIDASWNQIGTPTINSSSPINGTYDLKIDTINNTAEQINKIIDGTSSSHQAVKYSVTFDASNVTFGGSYPIKIIESTHKPATGNQTRLQITIDQNGYLQITLYNDSAVSGTQLGTIDRGSAEHKIDILLHYASSSTASDAFCVLLVDGEYELGIFDSNNYLRHDRFWFGQLFTNASATHTGYMQFDDLKVEYGDTIIAADNNGLEKYSYIPNSATNEIIATNYHIPPAIDLATGTVRLTISIVDITGALPVTSEIEPGTISIHRKAEGDGTWVAVVTDEPCLESAGLIYYDEVFDSVPGYAYGDTIRFTFKSQSVTVGATTYTISDSTGTYHYSRILSDVSESGVTVGDIRNIFSTEATTEPASPPSKTASIFEKINYLFALGKNKVETTSSTQVLKADDGSGTIGTSNLNYDGGSDTFTRGKFS